MVAKQHISTAGPTLVIVSMHVRVRVCGCACVVLEDLKVVLALLEGVDVLVQVGVLNLALLLLLLRHASHLYHCCSSLSDVFRVH